MNGISREQNSPPQGFYYAFRFVIITAIFPTLALIITTAMRSIPVTISTSSCTTGYSNTQQLSDCKQFWKIYCIITHSHTRGPLLRMGPCPRERERERETDRQTDRQRGKEREGETERERERERQTERDRDREHRRCLSL